MKQTEIVQTIVIKLIWYYTQLTEFVPRGLRASQPCAISKDF